MASIEDELNKLREEVERRIKEVSDLIDAEVSRFSQLEERLGSEINRGTLWDELSELKGLKRRIETEKNKAKESLQSELHELKRKIRETSSVEDREVLEELTDRFEDLKGFGEDKLDELEDRLESFSDRVEELEEKIKDRISELREATGTPIRGFTIPKPEIKIPEIKLPDFGRLFEESFSRAWTGVPSAIVSSVRLSQADLNLIDALVDAGMFKSRNEGIAFFAHRGIEASKDWLTKIREKLDSIRQLQEETKKEIEGMAGEPAVKDEGPPHSDSEESGKKG